MKNISIQKISITNFKGIRNQEISFESTTGIYGANGTGKSSIYDAFLWLLFGKNSDDRKDFSIKNTVDLELNRQEHEVSGIFIVDNESHTLRRVYKEKWQKKRGEETSEYTGNETVYYWNEVPMNQKDFQSKVSDVFMEESNFKLITNTNAFYSLKWQDRRMKLIQAFGDVTDAELAKGNEEFEALLENLTKGKTMEDYKKQIVASVTKSKQDLKNIPTRIDEVLRSKPGALDFVSLKAELDVKEAELEKLDKSIQNKSAAFDAEIEELNQSKLRINSLKGEISTIEINTKNEATDFFKTDNSALETAKKSIGDKRSELETAKNALTTLSGKLKTKKSELEGIELKIANKRKEWETENAKEISFDETSFCCPTCQRDFEKSDIENKKTEMTGNFRKEKSKKLSEISASGKSLSEEKENLEKEISDFETRIKNGNQLKDDLQTTIEDLELKIENLGKANDVDNTDKINSRITEKLLENIEYNEKKALLENLEENKKEDPKIDTQELSDARKQVQLEIDGIKESLAVEIQIKTADNRVLELKNEEKSLAQTVADVERTQFLIERFEKLKMATLEEKVNSKFKMVKFRMFETQVNGGEAPACEILVNGVPFADANTASRINAGIDIISTLSECYEVHAPIFIDGAESIHDIIPTESQLITLVVSKDDKSLRVA